MHSINGQYITTSHQPSDHLQWLSDQRSDNDDAYTVTFDDNDDIFSTLRLLPAYTETSISDNI